jgi:hypothetical protein
MRILLDVLLGVIEALRPVTALFPPDATLALKVSDFVVDTTCKIIPG